MKKPKTELKKLLYNREYARVNRRERLLYAKEYYKKNQKKLLKKAKERYANRTPKQIKARNAYMLARYHAAKKKR